MKNNKDINILIVTTPIRPKPASFPPIGSLSIIKALKKAGYQNIEFYNIDGLRPSYSEVIRHIKDSKPDILGISAVVSTAYEYSKKLSLDIKKVLPKTTILLGGNLGASAEVILEKTGVDFICTGEGERTIVDFADCWLTAQTKNDFNQVKGLAFFNEDNQLNVTPYPDSIPAEEVYDVDFEILVESGQKDFFFAPIKDNVIINFGFHNDPRTFDHHRKGKRLGTIPGSKGCVARCNFCHRWDKGIRYIPVPIVMERLDMMIQKYDVGFVEFADENFGTDKKWLIQFIQEVKKRDLLWRVGGMRVNTITSDLIRQMKEAGCVAIFYGMESGSQKMLDVMEKVTKVEQNYNAVKWMAESNVFTIVQLIIGMPGETPETIKETSRFSSFFVEQSPNNNPNLLSINFAQALPGTSLYEMGRHMGRIGQTINTEEEYLIKVSDRDARDGETYVNFTDYPQLLLEKWHYEIQNITRHAYIEKWGLNNYYKVVMGNKQRYQDLAEVQKYIKKRDSGYYADPARTAEAISDDYRSMNDRKEETVFDPKQIPSLWSLFRQNSLGAAASFYPKFFWRARSIIIIFVILNCFRKMSAVYCVKLLAEYIGFQITSIFIKKRSQLNAGYMSLRKFLRKKTTPYDNPAMAILRKGR
jgi:anaerobic magnesium-protoporphyrin IX monomethyl ester cyclase